MAINANVSGGQQITANVGETKIDVAVSGGVGPTGTAGAAASVQVGTVTTGAPGSSASVVNAGTSSAAVLNFTIPAGATGATGPAGSNATATTDASALVSGTLPDARLSSSIARTADVTAAVAAVVNAAPATLDTLAELASALGSDANFSTTVTNSLAAKAPLANPTFTGTVSGITAAMVGLGNVANVDARARSSHTGTQAISTVSGLQAALDAKASLSGASFTGGAYFGSDVDVDGVLGASAVVSASSIQGRTLFLAAIGGGPVPFSVNNAGQVVAGTWLASAIAVDRGGTGATTASAARTNLGLVIGTDVAAASHTQAWSTITVTPTTLSGYGITDAVASSDARLTDARTPLAHNQAWSTITSTPTTLAGYGITDAVGSSDSRLSDARTPTAHKSSHATGGSDALTPADIGAATQHHTHSALDVTSGTLALARLPIVLEQTQTVGNSGTSTTLALTTGSVQTVTLSGNCTFTMPSPTAGASITLILTQGGTFTATFTSVLWAGGTAPTITATSNKRDILVFVSDGTNWYGTASQNH